MAEKRRPRFLLIAVFAVMGIIATVFFWKQIVTLLFALAMFGLFLAMVNADGYGPSRKRRW